MRTLLGLLLVIGFGVAVVNVTGCASTDNQAEPQFLQGEQDHPRHDDSPESHYNE